MAFRRGWRGPSWPRPWRWPRGCSWERRPSWERPPSPRGGLIKLMPSSTAQGEGAERARGSLPPGAYQADFPAAGTGVGRAARERDRGVYRLAGPRSRAHSHEGMVRLSGPGDRGRHPERRSAADQGQGRSSPEVTLPPRAGGRRRFADHELGGEGGQGEPLTPELAEEGRGGGVPHPEGRLAHGAERRPRQGRARLVVEANDRDVPRHPDPPAETCDPVPVGH